MPRLPLASSSRLTIGVAPRAARAYAAPVATGALDVRADVLRATLYPSDGVNPNSSSPIGARHTKYAERLAHILPSVDAHETIERAWALYRRRQRDARERALSAKFDAMADACAELESVSVGEHKALYDRAMVRMAHGAAANVAAAQGVAQGRKKTPESRWKEARPEGLVPREAWVPTETRGKGWNYEWTRPEN